MTIDVYLMPISPPCRSVLMTARYLNISVNQKLLDLRVQEHLKPEFIKINPQHCVPTIDDNGFILWESRAIMTYLVNKYAPNSSLYPKDPEKRAIIDRILYFDVGVFQAAREFLRPQVFGEPADPEKEKVFRSALAIIEGLLKDSPYVAGDHITLADISIYSWFSFADLANYSFDSYTNITTWLQKIKSEIPGDQEINQEPIAEFKEYVKTQKKESPLK